jgi:hypothetical protein
VEGVSAGMSGRDVLHGTSEGNCIARRVTADVVVEIRVHVEAAARWALSHVAQLRSRSIKYPPWYFPVAP